MPTYEYECTACDGKFELFQAMSDAPMKKCALCGKPNAQRLIGTGAGIIFKGNGFYETDYKRAGDKKTETKSPTSDAPSKTATSNSSGTNVPKAASEKHDHSVKAEKN